MWFRTFIYNFAVFMTFVSCLVPVILAYNEKPNPAEVDAHAAQLAGDQWNKPVPGENINMVMKNIFLYIVCYVLYSVLIRQCEKLVTGNGNKNKSDPGAQYADIL